MTIQRVYLESIGELSDEFQDFQQRFNNTLLALYEVNYAETVPGYLGEAADWDPTPYYHGHIFTPVWTVAKDYAARRDRDTRSKFSSYRSIFVCIGRNILTSPKGKDYRFVQKGNEIIPAF